MTLITGADNIRMVQLLAQRSACKLEVIGLTHSGGSLCARLRKHYKAQGDPIPGRSKQEVVDFLTAKIEQAQQER